MPTKWKAHIHTNDFGSFHKSELTHSNLECLHYKQKQCQKLYLSSQNILSIMLDPVLFIPLPNEHLSHYHVGL